jgi:riboflavin-specific deaminase-like protein
VGIKLLYHQETGNNSEEIYKDLSFPIQGEKPYVVINMVSSVDGKATINGELKKTPIGSNYDRQQMGWIRQAVDVVIRGAGTVRANPVYPFLSEEQKEVRKKKGLNENVLAAVITRSGNLPLQGSLFAQAPLRPIVFIADTVTDNEIADLAAYADIERITDAAGQLDRVLGILHSKYRAQRVLLEGGPTLNYWFIRNSLVDEIFLTVAPRLIGGEKELTIVHGDASFNPMPGMELISAYLHENELFLRYKIKSVR